MKRLLLIPVLSLPMWLYSCMPGHKEPTARDIILERVPAEVFEKANPPPEPPVIITPSRPEWPQTKETKRAPKRPTARHHHRVSRVETAPSVPVVIPPRCLFWYIGEAGCLPPDAWYQAYGYAVPKDDQ